MMPVTDKCEEITEGSGKNQNNSADSPSAENYTHSLKSEFVKAEVSPPLSASEQSQEVSTKQYDLSPLKELEKKRSLSRIIMEFQRKDSVEKILEIAEQRDQNSEAVKCNLRESMKCSESDYSSSSDIETFPIVLDDITCNTKKGSSEDDFNYSPTQPGRFFPKSSKPKKKSRGKRNWKHALRSIKCRGDQWEEFGLSHVQTERGIRHRYNPMTMEWYKEDCIIKIDMEPFAHGAMRECFRMKKLSNFSLSNDWLRDSNNYVAKSYMDPKVERNNYFQDVQLQMDAKLWGEEYNRHNPPKKIDIFMMAVIELPDRPGKPLYHIEHYIEGEYVKYNSNSGFVDHGGCRQTPQAFSHFTFERSGHELMVVDVQGVGDLYTDPQIHTAVGEEYGDGNLGTRGMALFFHSHKCNTICESLGLKHFDLSAKEMKCFSVPQSDSIISETKVKLDQVLHCESSCSSSHEKRMNIIRSESQGFVDFDKQGLSRSNLILSGFSKNFSRYNSEEYDDCESESHSNQAKSVSSIEAGDGLGAHVTTSQEKKLHFHVGNLNLTDTETSNCSSDSGITMQRGRQRKMTVEDWMENDKTGERHEVGLNPRPSCISAEALKVEGILAGEESVLGQIHLDLAKYHETCRFDEIELDIESAWFHLKAAADCYNLSACVALSQILAGLLNDVLPVLTKEDVSPFVSGHPGQVEDIGLDYMTRAANAGDVTSVLYLARAYDTGLNLGVKREASVVEAVRWYNKALEIGAEDSYILQARLAEILLTGGEGVKSDPLRAGELYNEAAEAAIANMKGKLANRYYMLAEEAWACVEE